MDPSKSIVKAYGGTNPFKVPDTCEQLQVATDRLTRTLRDAWMNAGHPPQNLYFGLSTTRNLIHDTGTGPTWQPPPDGGYHLSRR